MKKKPRALVFLRLQKGDILLSMPKNQKGFAYILLVIAAGIFLLKPSKNESPLSKTLEKVKDKTSQPSKTSGDTPPLLIKNIGVNLGYFDNKTNKAGDFVFSKQYLNDFNQPFMGFGYVIPAKFSSTGNDKANPQPTFILPIGTKVHSIVDGVVANIPKLYSGDFSIQVSENGKMEKWIYETEHVINPMVKVGDKVVAGQEIAEVSDYDRNLKGFGIVEIGILKGGNPPQHICPFTYLDPAIKEDVFSKIKAFYKSWEDYTGDTKLYNEEAETIPGCVSLDPIDG